MRASDVTKTGPGLAAGPAAAADGAVTASQSSATSDTTSPNDSIVRGGHDGSRRRGSSVDEETGCDGSVDRGDDENEGGGDRGVDRGDQEDEGGDRGVDRGDEENEGGDHGLDRRDEENEDGKKDDRGDEENEGGDRGVDGGDKKDEEGADRGFDGGDEEDEERADRGVDGGDEEDEEGADRGVEGGDEENEDGDEDEKEGEEDAPEDGAEDPPPPLSGLIYADVAAVILVCATIDPIWSANNCVTPTDPPPAAPPVCDPTDPMCGPNPFSPGSSCVGVDALVWYAFSVGLVGLICTVALQLTICLGMCPCVKRLPLPLFRCGGLTVTVEKLLAFLLLLWWIVGACVVTFRGPFTSTSNGYFAAWGGLIGTGQYAVPVLLKKRPENHKNEQDKRKAKTRGEIEKQQDRGKTATSRSLGGNNNSTVGNDPDTSTEPEDWFDGQKHPLVSLFACSIVLLIASIPESSNSPEGVWGLSCGCISAVISLVAGCWDDGRLTLVVGKKRIALAPGNSWGHIAVAALLVCMWIAAAAVLTFRGPFDDMMGNGYFASWLGLLWSVYYAIPQARPSIARVMENAS